MKIILLIVLFALVPGVFALAWYLDKIEWNGGKCRSHDRRWIYFDTDSQGGRGYKCAPMVRDGCSTWISWFWIDSK